MDKIKNIFYKKTCYQHRFPSQITCTFALNKTPLPYPVKTPGSDSKLSLNPISETAIVLLITKPSNPFAAKGLNSNEV